MTSGDGFTVGRRGPHPGWLLFVIALCFAATAIGFVEALWLRGMREARAVNYAEAVQECSAALRIADSARLVGYLPIRLVPLDSGRGK